MTTMTMTIDDRAASLAESWINGNRSDVAGELEAAGVDGTALALYVATKLAESVDVGGSAAGGYAIYREVLELSDYMRRRAEQRAVNATSERRGGLSDEHVANRPYKRVRRVSLPADASDAHDEHHRRAEAQSAHHR